MNDIERKIELEKEKIYDKYLNSAAEMAGAYKSDRNYAKDYEGRQIYELLQNAEDASDGQGYIKFELNGNVLKISNTGIPFGFDGVSSLMRSSTSTKKRGKIGNKGLGFRSVLTWAKTVKVKTRDFTVEFSKEYANELYASLINEKPSIATEIKRYTKDKCPISALTYPKLINERLTPDSLFATEITVVCTKTGVESFLSQVCEIEQSDFVFLPELNKIDFIIDDKLDCTYEKLSNDNAIQVNFINNFTGEITEGILWRLFKEEGTYIIKGNNDEESTLASNNDDEELDYSIMIAYDAENHTSGEYLYNYFKTDVDFSYPALVHATIDLTGNRNMLVKDSEQNKFILEKVADKLVEIANVLAKEDKLVGYEGLKFLIPESNDKYINENYDFNKLVLSKLKKCSILPTINNQYISMNDNPHYFNDAFSSYLKGKHFPTLLKNANNEVEKFIMKTLEIEFYEPEEFTGILNAHINEYTLMERAKLLELMHDNYYYFDENIPNLVIDKNGDTLEATEEVFVIPNDIKFDIPKWVNVNFIHPDMIHIVLEDKKWSIEEFCNKFQYYKFNLYNTSSIYKTMSEVIELNPNNTNYMDEAFEWLWNCYNVNLNVDLTDAKIYVKCRDGNYSLAYKTYLGKEYDNEFGEKIISSYCSDKFVSSDLNIDIKNPKFIDFLKSIHVSKYPKIYKYNAKQVDTKFIDYYRNIDIDSMRIEIAGIRQSPVPDVIIRGIENFESIAKNSNTEELLAWILLDDRINKAILSKSEIFSDSYLKGYWKDAKRINTWNEKKISNSNIPSYIRYQFETSNWIKTEKYDATPGICVFEKLKLEPLLFYMEIDYDKINELVGYDSKEDVERILLSLGALKNFKDIKKNHIYQIMNDLPEVDKDCTLGKKFYLKLNDLIKSTDVDRYIKRNTDYNEYKANGYILTTCNGQSKYIRNNEAYYTDTKVYSNSVIEKYPMIPIGYKAGAEKIKKLFCVNELKSVKIDIIGNPSINKFNDQFNDYYNFYIPYVYACKILRNPNYKSNLGVLKKHGIVICNELNLRYSEKGIVVDENKLENYGFYVDSKLIYILIPNDDFDTFEEMKASLKFADIVADVLCFIMKSDEDKLLFRDLFIDNKENRDYKMLNDLGDSNLENLTEAQRLFNKNPKEYFWNTIAKIKGIEINNDNDVINKLRITKDVIDSIDYDNLFNKLSNDKTLALINLLRLINIDVNQINNVSIFRLVLTDFWKEIIVREKNKLRSRYLYYIYENLLEDPDNVINFKKLRDEFDDEPIGNINTIYIDVDDYIEDTYKISFDKINVNVNIDEIIEKNKIDFHKRYPNEYEKIKEENSIEDIQIYSLFNRLKDLMIEDVLDEAKKEIDYSFNANPTILDDIRVINVEAFSINKKPKLENDSEINHEAKLKKTKRNITKQDDRKNKSGRCAEHIIYEYLCKSGYETKWVSGNAEIEKEISEGDDSLGYDIKYIDDNGNYQYVEVKSTTTSNIEFILSETEKDAAFRYGENYLISFVMFEGNSSKPAKVLWLKNLFEFSDDESFENNSKFNVSVKKEYHISIDSYSEIDESDSSNDEEITDFRSRLHAIAMNS